MSKVDAQRAMREARYAAYRASRAAADAPPKQTPPPAARVKSPEPPAVPEGGATAAVAAVGDIAAPAEPDALLPSADATDEPELCGHRNIGNKTCRRPAGHTEANHRYR